MLTVCPLKGSSLLPSRVSEILLKRMSALTAIGRDRQSYPSRRHQRDRLQENAFYVCELAVRSALKG
jgi:hypothetical protein